jgi:DHA1 family inner membrane transport protein
LGATGFTTVAPLQMWGLSKVGGAGQSLASSLNLGNAIGAWASGMVIGHGPGIAFVAVAAAIFPLPAIATAFLAFRTTNAGDRTRQPNQTTQMTGSNYDAI